MRRRTSEIFVLARTKESIRGIISVAMHARLSIQSSKDSFGNDGGSELWRAATAERVPTQLLVLLRPEVEATVPPPSPPTPCPGRIAGSSANADVDNVGFAIVKPRPGGSPLFFMLSVVTAIDINFLKDALYQRFLI